MCSIGVLSCSCLVLLVFFILILICVDIKIYSINDEKWMLSEREEKTSGRRMQNCSGD
jgi:hypothetical protein